MVRLASPCLKPLFPLALGCRGRCGDLIILTSAGGQRWAMTEEASLAPAPARCFTPHNSLAAIALVRAAVQGLFPATGLRFERVKPLRANALVRIHAAGI
jgi:hypothetical protein